MVYAFLIHTLNQRTCDVLYYRVYSSYNSVQVNNSGECEDANNGRNVNNTALFDTPVEKKELINHIANKIQMQYFLKLKHSILPGEDLKGCFVKGVYKERGWRDDINAVVVWQGAPGLGFAMVCKEHENIVQAQNVMHIITSQLEKHLQFISNPVVPLRLVETVALIVNQYLPAGQLLFINSKLLKVYEKQLEHDLFAK